MKIIYFLVGALFGVVAVYSYQYLPFNTIYASGVLQYEEPVGPEVTASFPAGYYVKDRIYIDGCDKSMVGKSISTHGIVGIQHSELMSYPKIKKNKVSVHDNRDKDNDNS